MDLPLSVRATTRARAVLFGATALAASVAAGAWTLGMAAGMGVAPERFVVVVAAVLLVCGGCAVPGWSALRLGLVRRARLHVADDRLEIVHDGLFRSPLVIPRAAVGAVAIDPGPGRRRFAVGGAWLHSSRYGSPLPLVSNVGEPPTVAVVFTVPLWLEDVRPWARVLDRHGWGPLPHERVRGLLLPVADPDAAREALAPWAVVRDLTPADVAPLLATARDSRRPVARSVAVAALVAVAFAAVRVGLADPSEAVAVDSEGCRRVGAVLDRRPRWGPEVPAHQPVSMLLPIAPPGFYTVPHGDRALTRAEVRGASRFGYQHGWRREWRTREGDRLVQQVLAYDTHGGALDSEAAAARDDCVLATEAFALDAVPGTVGLQLRTAGRVTEQVSWVRGTRRIVLRLRTDDVPAGHGRITELVGAADVVATRAPAPR